MKKFAIGLVNFSGLAAAITFVVGIFLPIAFTIGSYIAEQVHEILPAKVSVEKGLNE